MRTLCLLLILANVLFFVWSQLIDVQVSALDSARAPNAVPPPRIVLAREVAPAQSGEETDSGAIRDVEPPDVEPLAAQTQSGAAASTDSLSCTSVGPFADLPQAAQAQAALRSAGYQPRQRLEQGELWVGYWVSIQNLTNRNQAEAAVEKLNDNRVTDVYLMPESDPPNVVSLGVFSDYQRAQRRVNQVRALGLEPRISDRKRAGSVYWIDVDLPEPGQGLDTSVFQTGEARIMRLEMRACPEEGND
ncbi:MAG: SPOR domain-containing protein [Steroidobacter sp.]